MFKYCLRCGISLREAIKEMRASKYKFSPPRCRAKWMPVMYGKSSTISGCMLDNKGCPVAPGTWCHDEMTDMRKLWSSRHK